MSTTITPNAEMLHRTLATVEGLRLVPDDVDWDTPPPEGEGPGWAQFTWRCRSGMCFAGWAADLAGAHWKVPDFRYLPDRNGDVGSRDCDATVITPAGDEAFVWDYAREVLGITDVQASELFEPSNDIDDLRAIVAALTGEAPQA